MSLERFKYCINPECSQRQKVSRWLADLIDELMAQSPQKRPKNVQEILERLERKGRKGLRKGTQSIAGGIVGW